MYSIYIEYQGFEPFHKCLSGYVKYDNIEYDKLCLPSQIKITIFAARKR